MKISPQQLEVQLNDKLESLYFAFGGEILLVENSINLIQKTAKKQGFNEKISFEVDGNFNWEQLFSEISSGSLFSPNRIIHCRLKSGKIGVKGSKALTEIASSIPEGILLIVSTGTLEKNQQNSKWFKTLAEFGAVIQHWPVNREHLHGWILNHMSHLGLKSNKAVAEHIAFYTEGNLLATQQEIEKLKMAYPDGNIDTDSYIKNTQQQSKYSIYGLIDAALSGDAKQVLKIYQTMVDDTKMPIALSSVLYPQLNTLVHMSIELQQNQSIESVIKKHRIWQSKKQITVSALKRHSYQYLQKLLLSLGRIDRSIKGMDNLDVQDELRKLLLKLSGKTQWAQ